MKTKPTREVTERKEWWIQWRTSKTRWANHQKANKHHWQYWVLVNDSDEPKLNPLPMPEKYCREMVADWMGAGIAITGRMEVATWYGKNKDKIMLHESTRRDVELLISSIENTYRVGRMLGVETT